MDPLPTLPPIGGFYLRNNPPLVVGRGTTVQGTSSLFIFARSIGPSSTLSIITCMNLPSWSLSSTELFENHSLPATFPFHPSLHIVNSSGL